MRYEAILEARINDEASMEEERRKARSEKSWFDRQSQSDKEEWVINKTTQESSLSGFYVVSDAEYVPGRKKRGGCGH